MSLVVTSDVGGIRTLSLNNPERRNAITLDMAAAIEDAVGAASEDPKTRAIIITGLGRAFCAGADLTALRAANEAKLRAIYGAFVAVRDCPLPTVAAVNGPAVGAGLNLALSCDVRLAATSATFDARFLRIPIHPGGGHFWMLEQLVGRQAAAAISIFDEAVSGPRAAEIGLAWRCVNDADLLNVAQEFCEALSEAPATLGRRMKQTLVNLVDYDAHDRALEAELQEQLWCVAQEEYRGRMPGNAR